MANSSVETNILSLTSRLEPALADAGKRRAAENDVLIRLIRELQASLEIEEILAIFLREIHGIIPVDGLDYLHAETGARFRSAAQGLHKVSYELNAQQQDLGTLSFSRNLRFSQADLTCLENLISCLFYPLRNGLKYRQALLASQTDPLTGAGNRSALDTALRREISIAQRDEIPLSLVIFDFDHFKAINDSHGHQCGDLVLKQCLWQIRQILRRTDLLFRYGGEEFVMVLHKTELQGGLNVAEKIRRCVEQSIIQFDRSLIRVSASFGVAALGYQDELSSLIERADSALYRAKQGGRNRVCSQAVTETAKA